MKTIGITGSLGTGKSLVSNYFKEKGHLVISADEINNELLKQKKIVKKINMLLFNKKSKVLNKKLIAESIFNDFNKKEQLEAYLHPLIYKRIAKIINKSKEKVVFIEVPLLYETNFIDLVDYVIVVFTDLENQIDRIVKRDNISKEEAMKRINSQMPLKDKISKADYVINNSNSVTKTINQLDSWYKHFKRGI